MKKILIAILILGVVILLTLTCPKKECHVGYLTHQILTAIEAENKEKDEIINAIINNIGAYFIESTIKNRLIVEDYVVFNLDTISYQGSKRIITIGVLNHVFTTIPQEEMQKLVNSYKENNNMKL